MVEEVFQDEPYPRGLYDPILNTSLVAGYRAMGPGYEDSAGHLRVRHLRGLVSHSLRLQRQA